MKKVLTVAGLAAFAISAMPVADAKADGEEVWGKCVQCHLLSEDMDNGKKIGPNLWGIVGAKPAHNPTYEFSDSYQMLADNGVVWDAETLDAYLTNPRKYLKEALPDVKRPKTKMTFFLKKEEDRKAVIEYLATKK